MRGAPEHVIKSIKFGPAGHTSCRCGFRVDGDEAATAEGWGDHRYAVVRADRDNRARGGTHVGGRNAVDPYGRPRIVARGAPPPRLPGSPPHETAGDVLRGDR